MKFCKLKFFFVIFVVAIIVCNVPNVELSKVNNVYAKSQPMRGVWVSTLTGMDFPNKPTNDSGVLKAEIKQIVKKCKEVGFNTVFLQVRPCADAFYDSEVFPWSFYLTGEAGLAPTGRFDPLEYWVDICHENSIDIHAWINPYRITVNGDTEFNRLPKDHPAVLYPEYVVKYTDGNYYFNPGIPAVNDLVYEGAAEILQNYDVDGLHLDDYFYPGPEFDDELTFQEYNFGGFSNKADWRRNNVDTLVKSLHNLSRISGAEFGVSPIGIWDNLKTNPLGSNTNGRSSYTELFADSRGWVKKGYVDYIAPQIYWEFGHSLADYETVANWWVNVCKGTDVKLYIGLADYKTIDVSSESPWYAGIQILKQMDFNTLNSGIDGEIHFRSKLVFEDSFLWNTIEDYYAYYEDDYIITSPEVETSVNTENTEKGDIRVFVSGREVFFDSAPIVEDDRILVPMRAIFEALGANVTWNQSTNSAVVKKDGTVIAFTPGSYIFEINSERYLFDVPAKVVNERIVIPLRAVSEVMGYYVKWNSSANCVSISENQY